MNNSYLAFRLAAALFMIVQSAGPMLQGELVPFV